MPMNIPKLQLRDGKIVLVGVQDCRCGIYKILERKYDYNSFSVEQYSSECVIRIAQMIFDPFKDTLHDLAERHGKTRNDSDSLLTHFVYFDREVRDALKDADVTLDDFEHIERIELSDDQNVLALIFRFPEEGHDVTFEQYIEKCRREGEEIHPEIDRQLRYFKSVSHKYQIQLPHRPSKRSRYRSF